MELKKEEQNPPEEKSFFRVIVHSFFIIPFLIAVFCLLLFVGMKLLTQEKRTAYDYLEDVKTGGLPKRWQSAFELSKILANSKSLPEDERFRNELISAFEHAKGDDPRVRQYLALAMGRTGQAEYVQPLLDSLNEEKEESLPAIIYALGMLKDKRSAAALYHFMDNQNPRIRSITAVSLGNIAEPASLPSLKKGLRDTEANVQWGSAISLAQMKDAEGKEILLKLLDRTYLSGFPEVDQEEQTNLILSAIDASVLLNDPQINTRIKEISQSDSSMRVRSAALKALNNG